MSPGAITFITYLWHYLVARLVYDELLRPLIHGHGSTPFLACAAAALAFALGRWSAKRSWRGRPAGPRRRA